MRCLPLALIGLLSAAWTVGAAEFQVTTLNALPPSGDVVAHAAPGGERALAYQSLNVSEIVYGETVGGQWNFSTAASGVSSFSEVALAFDADGEPNIVYSAPNITWLRRVSGVWESAVLVPSAASPSLDFEIGADGSLHVVYVEGTAVRSYERSSAGHVTYGAIWGSSVAASCVDLELDSLGNAHATFWHGVDGNTTSEKWGRSEYAIQNGATWNRYPLPLWTYAPALALDANDVAHISCYQHSYYTYGDQKHFAWTGSAFEERVIQNSQITNLAVLGSAIVADENVHVLSRSNFWRESYGVLVDASVAQATTMGREGMLVDPDGSVFAAYRNGVSLKVAALSMDGIAAPTIQSFTAPEWVYVDTEATLTWETTDAAGVAILPDGASISSDEPSVYKARPQETTEFTLVAVGMASSASQSSTVEVRPHEPVINDFIAIPYQITATQDVILHWDCSWTDYVTVDPIGYQTYDVLSGKLVNPPETTTYTLTAHNQYGTATAEVTVEVVRPFEIRSFAASSGIVGREDAVRLQWDVFGIADVEIEDVGPVDQKGYVMVVPGVSRDYTLTATHGTTVETASVHIDVNDDFLHSRFYLSWSPDEIVLEPPGLSVYQNFVVYVLGVSLEGGAITGVEFGIDFPEGLVLMGSDLFSERAINILQPPDYIVGLGQCFILDDIHLLAALNFMAMDQSTIDEGDIRLRPAAIPSVEGTVAYATCAFDLNGSELEGPLASALQGPPLYLSTDRVPVLQLDFKAAWDDGMPLLTWADLSLELIDELEIQRGQGSGEWQRVARFDRTQLRQTRGWIDHEAPGSVELRYAVRARANGVVIAEEFAKLESDSGLPERTQFLGAYPNPFNPQTTLRFAAQSPGPYELRVLNAAGRMVRSLALQVSTPGIVERDWDGRDELGQPAASGVYYVQLSGDGVLDQLRIVLLK